MFEGTGVAPPPARHDRLQRLLVRRRWGEVVRVACAHAVARLFHRALVCLMGKQLARSAVIVAQRATRLASPCLNGRGLQSVSLITAVVLTTIFRNGLSDSPQHRAQLRAPHARAENVLHVVSRSSSAGLAGVSRLEVPSLPFAGVARLDLPGIYAAPTRRSAAGERLLDAITCTRLSLTGPRGVQSSRYGNSRGA